MNPAQIHIPLDLPDEARHLVEVVNELLRSITLEMSEFYANPTLCITDERRDLNERCEIPLNGFKEMREDLQRYGLEWSELPEYVGD
ncbi:MAG TPA: hypothetical protein VGJ02_06795 [Pyrinomonadaceae bacterium]|jgi:hypothetical protein